MTNHKAIEGTNITAFQMGEFWNQVGAGLINRQTIQFLLERRNPFITEVWKTIKIGDIFTVEEMIKRLERSCSAPLNEQCLETLRRQDFTLSDTIQEIDLAIVTGKDLGFKERHSESALVARAEALGLVLCPAEVGPQLRLQSYHHYNEELLIAMKRLGNRFGFQLRGEHGKCEFYSHDGNDNIRWPEDGRWIFMKPRK